jgi:replication-associated recombination protein RarA
VELRLYEKYRPKSLAEIVGQPVVGQLQEIAERPFPLCVLIEGPTGTGKTTAAYALAQDMGCYDTTVWPGCHTVCGADFTAEMARHWFGPETPLRFVAPGKGYHVMVIEELEYLNPTVQVLCKDYFERRLGSMKVVLVATSNDASKLVKPLRHRFRKLAFTAGKSFAVACNKRLSQIWAIEAPDADMPHGWEQFGWDGQEFSFRQALDTLDCYLNVLKMREAG